MYKITEHIKLRYTYMRYNTIERIEKERQMRTEPFQLFA